ncbi:MAG: serine/threonine protein kinase [Gammaproteobacteria bacterium]|nr:serine/threonine protein kinase [Gammaproteobacteria bacterium]NNJ95697.1 serine/threonine protein kinase [Gammaproteobacteria bacterium]
MTLEDDYNALTPDIILQAVDSVGFQTSGRMLALNSYENRVYRVEQEQDVPLVVKFYRPARWSDEAILEEHDFAQALAAEEIPVVAPMVLASETLLQFGGYRFALYPMQGGRWPDLEYSEDRVWMGRFIARIHAVGKRQSFQHRQAISIQRQGREAADYLLTNGFIPGHLEPAYQTLVADLLQSVTRCFDQAGGLRILRLHGDCHRGNVLWTDRGPHFVDLDDCCNGPAMQDLWMLLSGERPEMTVQMIDLLEGYSEFAALDLTEMHLIEALRTLRMMHYASWLATRWRDPAFPQAFPWFDTTQYWEQHVLELREQLARLQEPVLTV